MYPSKRSSNDIDNGWISLLPLTTTTLSFVGRMPLTTTFRLSASGFEAHGKKAKCFESGHGLERLGARLFAMLVLRFVCAYVAFCGGISLWGTLRWRVFNSLLPLVSRSMSPWRRYSHLSWWLLLPLLILSQSSYFFRVVTGFSKRLVTAIFWWIGPSPSRLVNYYCYKASSGKQYSRPI